MREAVLRSSDISESIQSIWALVNLLTSWATLELLCMQNLVAQPCAYTPVSLTEYLQCSRIQDRRGSMLMQNIPGVSLDESAARAQHPHLELRNSLGMAQAKVMTSR